MPPIRRNFRSGVAAATVLVLAWTLSVTAPSPAFAHDKGDVSTVGDPAVTPPGVALRPKREAPSIPPRDLESAPPGARTAGGCVYNPLTSGVVIGPVATADFAFIMNINYWCAVGVRPQASDDWDLAVYSSTAPYPACVAMQLAASTGGVGVVDFIVGDFNYNPHGEYYVRPYPFSGTGASAVEWDDDANIITVNDYGTARSTGPNDVLECWDVYLDSGVQYTLSLGQTGGTQSELFLFRNPAGATTWQPRSSAVVALPGTSNGSTAYYTPPISGWYGVVVTNENGGTGTYAFRIDTCAIPAALTSGVTVIADRAPSPFAYTETARYWAAAAVRPLSPVQDWDVFLYRTQAGGPFPGCFSNLFENSTQGADVVDVVVGDFNYNPLATVYVDAIPTGLTSTNGRVEWESGSDLIGVNDLPLAHATGVDDLVTIWDVFLNSGTTYWIQLSAQSTNGGAAPDCWALLFRNHNPGFSYWANRQFADVQTQPPGALYSAPATGWYGLAIVNDDGATGEYKVGVFSQTAAVDPPSAAGVDHLSAIVPNPAHAAARIDFELAHDARVGFEIVDPAGRIAARLPAEFYPAGVSSVAWSRGSGQGTGASLRAGVYFVRMLANGLPVDTRRIVVLD